MREEEWGKLEGQLAVSGGIQSEGRGSTEGRPERERERFMTEKETK